jgi:hypothetical protein
VGLARKETTDARTGEKRRGQRWRALTEEVLKTRQEQADADTWQGRHSADMMQKESDARAATLDANTGKAKCPRCCRDFLNVRKHLTTCDGTVPKVQRWGEAKPCHRGCGKSVVNVPSHLKTCSGPAEDADVDEEEEEEDLKVRRRPVLAVRRRPAAAVRRRLAAAEAAVIAPDPPQGPAMPPPLVRRRVQQALPQEARIVTEGRSPVRLCPHCEPWLPQHHQVACHSRPYEEWRAWEKHVLEKSTVQLSLLPGSSTVHIANLHLLRETV